MTSTALDLSQIRTDALSSAATFRTLIGLGTLATQSPTGSPSASNFLRGDYSWQTIDLSGYVPYTGANANLDLGTYTLTTKSTTLSTGTITASTPALDVTQTWNNAAVTFTASKLNVVDTASASGSNLIDLQLNSVSQFKVVSGESDINGGSANKPALYSRLINVRSFYGSAFILNGASANNGLKIGQNTSGYLDITQNGLSIFNLTGYCNFSCESANVLAQRNVTNAQTFRIYNTTDSGITNYERAVLDWQTTSNVFRIGTEAGGTGTVRNIALVGGNVGIGTTPSGYKLHVNGAIRCTAFYAFGEAGIYASDTGTGILVGGGAAGSRGVISSDYRTGSDVNLYLSTFGNRAGSAGITIDTIGNVGISQTSPAAKLDILDTTSAGSGSLAASTLNIATTWNTTGTPTLIKANVTDTASNASSLLMDLQNGGSNRFSVAKDGTIKFGIPGNAGSDVIQCNGSYLELSSSNFNVIISTNRARRLDINTSGIYAIGSIALGFNSSAGQSLQAGFYSPANDIIEQRRTTNAQTYRLYGTYTDASNYRRLSLSSTTAGAFTLNAEGGGTGASGNTLELQTSGTTRMTIASTGTYGTITMHGVVANKAFGTNSWAAIDSLNSAGSQVGGFGYGGTGVSNFPDQMYLFGSGKDVVLAIDAAGTNKPIIVNGSTGLISFNGKTSSFPAIKRNGTALNFRLADDSADCDITAAALTLSGNLTISTKNIVTDTTTGTKIGTGTTQKLGFYNATPVVQPTAVADATDAASVITQLNALLSRMRDLGLVAT